MGIWNGKYNGDLHKKSGDQAPHGRSRKHDDDIHAAKIAAEHHEDRRLKEEEKHRKASRGTFIHPGADSSGHKNPAKMTPRELKAHGLTKQSGIFGTRIVATEIVQAEQQAAREAKRAKARQRQEARQTRGTVAAKSGGTFYWGKKNAPPKKKGFWS